MHRQALNFENNARSAQKSILGVKWDSQTDLSSWLNSRQIWRGFSTFSRILKNIDSERKIRIVPESLRNEIWQNVFVRNSSGTKKKRFVLKKVIFDFFGRFPMADCIQRLIEDFEVFTVFSPYGSTTNLCLKSVENHQFFIFRKNGPKLASYFFLSKKTNFWRNLSSSEVSSLKTGLIPIYQLNVLERSKGY